MKILILTNKIPYPPKDGGSIATFSLANSLSELAQSVKILALNTNKHYFDLKLLPSEISKKLPISGVDVNTNISIFQAVKNLFFSKLPYNAVRFNNKDFKKELTKILQHEEFDIIQLEGLYMCFYINIIRKLSNAKIVYRAHNVECEIWQRTLKNEKNLLKRKYISLITSRLQKMESAFLSKYDLLVPITKRDGEKLTEMGNNKPMHVSPTGIDISQLKSDKTELEFPSVFHIGALDWAPNQEGLIWFIENCWAEIQKAIPEVKFYIAGRNAPQWFENKTKKPGIHFLGEINDAYLFMNSKAVMIVPLLSGSGMRIKIVEGMAMKKTIVSTSIGTEGINSENKKNILIADSPSEFVQQIRTCLGNRAFFDEIGENALNFVQTNYNNIEIAKSLMNFYKKNI